MTHPAIDAARGWLGTPYRHQCSAKGAGADCLGLVRGVWREVVGPEPERAPPYTPSWSEPDASERLWRAARRWMQEIPPADARPGDVLLFRMRRGGPAKHLGILAEAAGGTPRMIHAMSGHGVVDSPLAPQWRRRIVAAFRFPR
jgi:putative phage cell wall peptidase, NlpC/P60 family